LQGQVFGLIDETAAKTSRVGLLNADDVIVLHQTGDSIKIVEPRRIREYVFPAVQKIVMVLGGADTRLNVIAQ
jgi:hypothetical protein